MDTHEISCMMRRINNETLANTVTRIFEMVDLIRELPPGPIDMSTVAQLFKVSDQTVRDWRKRKSNPLQATRMGKFYYTTREHIQAFSQQPQTQEPQALSIVEQMVDRILRRHGIIK